MREIDILIPTYNREDALVATLSGLVYQEEASFNVIVADQSEDESLLQNQIIKTLISLLQMKGKDVRILKNLPHRGMAQQRQFLLGNSIAPMVLFLDDDVLLEPYVLKMMKEILQKYQCGFVGSGLIGLSYKNDIRPGESHIEFWENCVEPEIITPGSDKWQRYKLHNAANVLHVQEKLGVTPQQPKVYKVAWSGGCVLYDRDKLKDCGGFEFWKQLPTEHCGEDVLAQLRVMKKYGGCGILPSGAYHLELETSLPNRSINAPQYLKI